MPLSAGTTFQDGQYVIDAYCSSDDMGETYLATAIASGDSVVLRVLPGQHSVDDEAVRQYQQQIAWLADRKLPGLVPGLKSFIESQRLYLVMTAQLGVPLTQLRSAMVTVHPAWTHRILQQVVNTLEALGPKVWHGLSLSPEQIWWHPESDVYRLSGFQVLGGEAREGTIRWGPALAALLYYLLLGEAIDQSPAPLDRLQQHPHLAAAFGPMLQEGLHPSDDFSPQRWLEQFPHELVSEAIAPKSAQPRPTAAHPYPSAENDSLLPQSGTSKLQLGLAFTAVAAGVAGLGFGLTLRLQSVDVAGRSRFNPEQAFPPLANWPARSPTWSDVDSETSADFERPYLESDPTLKTWQSPVEVDPSPSPSPAAVGPDPLSTNNGSPEPNVSPEVTGDKVFPLVDERPVVPVSPSSEKPAAPTPTPPIEVTPLPASPPPEEGTTADPTALPELDSNLNAPAKKPSMATSVVNPPSTDDRQAD